MTTPSTKEKVLVDWLESQEGRDIVVSYRMARDVMRAKVQNADSETLARYLKDLDEYTKPYLDPELEFFHMAIPYFFKDSE